MSDLSGITLANFRPIETCLFIGGLFLLRKYPRQRHRHHLWYRCGGHPLLTPCSVWSLKTLYQKKLSCFRRAFLF